MDWTEFSSKLKRKPDSDQEKVTRSLKNTIVSAGAGSGKTQTLANRFAYLITTGLASGVDRILTLTFTNKAAAEMYQRIHQTLKRYAQDDCPNDCRERAQKALDNFSKARIQTLDSYNAGILRQAASLYGIRPDFAPGSDGSRTRDLAFDFVMENRNSAAVQWISDPAKFEECAAFFADAALSHTSLADSANAKKKCQVFEQSLERQRKAVEVKWRPDKNPFFEIEKIIGQIQDAFPSQKPAGRATAWFDKGAEAIAFWESQKTSEARAFAREFIKSQSSFDAQALYDFATSPQILLVQRALEKFNITTKISDPEIGSLIKSGLFGTEESAPDLANQLNGILTFFQDLKFLQELHPLLDRFADKANEQKRRTGELTFKDVNELALLALKEQDALCKQERDSYDFIMIDEFQDNNAANRDLLLLISTDDQGRVMKDRLFFVGDEKQSIYKFRGADVSVFSGLQKYLPDCAALPMRRNYRSCSTLIDEFNQIFGGWLPGDAQKPSVQEPLAKIFEEEPERDYQAKFDQSARAIFPETKERDPKSAGAKIQVCLYPSAKTDPDTTLDENDAKALFVAKKIMALNQKQKVPFSKIALLAKSRTHYARIARIFALNKIPFTLDQQGNIFTQSAANDFYNALRLCVYPSDINAFAAFLNSPFAGLDLDDAQKILSLLPQKAFDQNIAAQDVLQGGALQRYRAAENFYREFSAAALSSPIVNSIDRLWRNEGYMFWPGADEEHYDLLFELARAADVEGKDLSWFVDQLAKAKGASFNSESEIDIKGTEFPAERTDAVNVMTIHKSKGLQFEYVFVWGMAEARDGTPPDSSKIFASEQFGPVTCNGSKKQNLFALIAAAENKSKDDAEARRLLYVALTRAEKGLFIIGKRPSDKFTPEGKKPALDLIVSYEKSEGDDNSPLPPPPFEEEEIPTCLRGSERPAEAADKKSLEEKMELFKAAKTIPQAQAKNYWTSPSELEEKILFQKGLDDENLPASNSCPEINSFVNASALQKNDYGTLFHSFMEAWSRDRDNWTAQKIGAAEYFKGVSLVQKISPKNREILLSAFFKILDKFLAQKDNPALAALQAGRPFRPEFKFKTKIGSYIISGSMDAVFENQDNTWTVLDYKTDLRPEPKIYYNQLAAYKKTAADLFANGDQSKIRCVLFFAETGQFVDITQEAQKALQSLDDEKIFNLIEK